MKLKILLPLLAIAVTAAIAVYVQIPVGFEDTLPAAEATTDQGLVGQKGPETARNTPPEIETEVVHGLEVLKDRL